MRTRPLIMQKTVDFRSILDGAGAPDTGVAPPAVLTGHPLCLRRLTALKAASTLGREDKFIIILICGSSPARLATVCLCALWPLALYLLPHGGVMACHCPHGSPFRAAYQTYPVDLFNFRTVASPHRPAPRWACADRRMSKCVSI